MYTNQQMQIELIKAETAFTKLEIQSTMLDRMLTMCNYVKRYGIDKSFLSLYNRDNRLSSVLGIKFPSCEDAATVGSPKDIISKRFIMAMEADAPAAGAAAAPAAAPAAAAPAATTPAANATQQQQPAANNATANKANGMFARIKALCLKIIDNVNKFSGGIFKQVTDKIVNFSKSATTMLDQLRSIKDLNVKTINYKEVSARAKQMGVVMNRLDALFKNAQGFIEGTVTDMSKISVTKSELVKLRTEIGQAVDTHANSIEKNMPWGGNRVSEVSACIKLIWQMQTKAKSAVDIINDVAGNVRNRIAAIPENPNPEQRNLLTRLKSGLDVILNVNQIAEKLAKWNGDTISQINTDVKNIVKAAGGGNADPNADAAAAATGDQGQGAQSQQQPAAAAPAAAPAAESWNFF
jgi:hypothetical protein